MPSPTTSSALSWPAEAVAEPILRNWIGVASNENGTQARALHVAMQTEDDGAQLLSAGFLTDVYLPSQPELLCALLVLGAAGGACLLLACCTLSALAGARRRRALACTTAASPSVASVSSASGASEAFWTSADSKKRVVLPRLVCTLCMLLWICLMGACALYACALGELITSGTSGNSLINTRQLIEETQDAEDAGAERFGRDAVQDEEGAEVLRKFEDLRELGYQYTPLVQPSVQVLLLHAVLLVFYLCMLLLALFATLIGLNHRLRHYRPSADYHHGHPAKASAAHASGFRARIRRVITCTALSLLVAAPLACAFGTALMVQAHAHLALCAQQQQTDQNAHIEHYVNARFSPRPLALPDFLADLQSERASVNAENCRADAEALHALWLSAMFLAFGSVPFALGILATLYCTSASATCAGAEDGSSVSLRAYVPGWVQNATLNPDAYGTIPELGSAPYQHYSISSGRSTACHPLDTSISQCSAGTFVYKKY